MKIFSPIGSKERLVEMFQNVNRVKLNEDFDQNNVLLNSFEKLKTNQLTVKNSKSKTEGDETFVEIIGTDENNNNIIFRIKIVAEESEQDNVLNVNNIELMEFKLTSPDGDEVVEMGENELREFNEQHSSELYDVVKEYVDIESEVENELYEEAIQKIDSYPFGGGSTRMQTGKAYADEKPTNDAIRVKSDELDKYVDEEENVENDIDIEQLAQEKEVAGEMLHGGKGDNKSPLEFDLDQVLMGLEVEKKEHSDNPLIALEIVLDHLSELHDYYTVKDNPEDSAQQNAAMDTLDNEDGGEEDIENVLLGYKPKNVGDGIEESVESELKQKNPAVWHQIQIAKKTLKMSDAGAAIMGGMTKEEARELLKKYNINVKED